MIDADNGQGIAQSITAGNGEVVADLLRELASVDGGAWIVAPTYGATHDTQTGYRISYSPRAARDKTQTVRLTRANGAIGRVRYGTDDRERYGVVLVAGQGHRGDRDFVAVGAPLPSPYITPQARLNATRDASATYYSDTGARYLARHASLRLFDFEIRQRGLFWLAHYNWLDVVQVGYGALTESHEIIGVRVSESADAQNVEVYTDAIN